jgi:hypothetical protein
MNLEDGDQFERENADWIRYKLPTYEILWREFIGNDGNAHPLEMSGLSEEQTPARKRFYQAHYSMAQSTKKIVEIVNSLEDVILKAKAEHTCHGQFDLLFCLLSRIGHVRDMVGKMDTALGMRGEAVNPLQEFYDLRSHVTHGPQMPFKIADDIIQIPRIGGRNPTESDWKDDKSWEEMNPDTFVPISTFCEATVKAFFELLTSIHQKIYSAAKDRYKGCKLANLQQNAAASSFFKAPCIDTSTMVPSYSACNISGKYWR